MKSDHVFKDIRDVPCDPQAHLHPAADVDQLLCERAVIDPEHAANGLRTVGHNAEGDGENRVPGHQSAKDLVVRGQSSPSPSMDMDSNSARSIDSDSARLRLRPTRCKHNGSGRA